MNVFLLRLSYIAEALRFSIPVVLPQPTIAELKQHVRKHRVLKYLDRKKAAKPEYYRTQKK